MKLKVGTIVYNTVYKSIGVVLSKTTNCSLCEHKNCSSDVILIIYLKGLSIDCWYAGSWKEYSHEI